MLVGCSCSKGCSWRDSQHQMKPWIYAVLVDFGFLSFKTIKDILNSVDFYISHTALKYEKFFSVLLFKRVLLKTICVFFSQVSHTHKRLPKYFVRQVWWFCLFIYWPGATDSSIEARVKALQAELAAVPAVVRKQGKR